MRRNGIFRFLIICFALCIFVFVIYKLYFEKRNGKITSEKNYDLEKVEHVFENNVSDEGSDSIQVESVIVNHAENPDENNIIKSHSGNYYSTIKSAVGLLGQINLPDNFEMPNDILNIYENTEFEITHNYLENVVVLLKEHGWNELELVFNDSYSFVLKNKIVNNKQSDIDKWEDCARSFLKDSGLNDLFENENIEIELERRSDKSITEIFGHLMYDGKRTGAYIRMIIEDRYVCGECQAYLYKSQKSLEVKSLSLEEALKQGAFYIQDDKGDIDTDEYTLANIGIKYVNGIPYYRFIGLGITTRSAIEGYALAVDLEELKHYEYIKNAIASFKIY